MRRRVLEVELNTTYDALVRGPGAYQLIVDTTGRPGIWSHQRRGFSLQEDSAKRVAALAEQLGYDIVITGPRSRPAPAPIVTAEVVADPGGGLW